MSCKSCQGLKGRGLPSPYNITSLVAISKERNKAIEMKIPRVIPVKAKKFEISRLHHFAKRLLEGDGIVLVECSCGGFGFVSFCINRANKSQRIDHIAFVIRGYAELP